MTDPFLDLLLHVPLASGLVWLANGVWPWLRGLRTLPEKAFVAGSLLIGTWALLDWLFLHTPNLDLAILISKVGITVFSLAWLAVLYFGRWLSRTRSWVDAVALLPVLGVIAMSWTVLVQGAEWTPGGWPRPLVDAGPYSVLIVQTAAYLALAFGYIGWDLRKAAFAATRTRTKLGAVFVALVITMAAWLLSNAYHTLTGSGGFPALSSILVVPGVLVLLFLAPVSKRDLLAIMRRLTITPARPFAAMWFHNSGQPLAQVVLPGESAPDAETLSDLSQAVDHLLVADLQGTPGSLRQLVHEKHSFVFERGGYLTLVVLLRGRPSEGLRSEMRSMVRGFEAAHRDRLGTWESAGAVAEEALTALDEVISPRIL
jgi:hypothetical protein